MEVDIDVPITVPPLHLYRVEDYGRVEITDSSYRGFSDRNQTVCFRIDDGEYVVVDDQKRETKLTVRNGQVVEAPRALTEDGELKTPRKTRKEEF